MEKTAVISGRVSEELRGRIDEVASRLRARNRSSFMRDFIDDSSMSWRYASDRPRKVRR